MGFQKISLTLLHLVLHLPFHPFPQVEGRALKLTQALAQVHAQVLALAREQVLVLVLVLVQVEALALALALEQVHEQALVQVQVQREERVLAHEQEQAQAHEQALGQQQEHQPLLLHDSQLQVPFHHHLALA